MDPRGRAVGPSCVWEALGSGDTARPQALPRQGLELGSAQGWACEGLYLRKRDKRGQRHPAGAPFQSGHSIFENPVCSGEAHVLLVHVYVLTAHLETKFMPRREVRAWGLSPLCGGGSFMLSDPEGIRMLCQLCGHGHPCSPCMPQFLTCKMGIITVSPAKHLWCCGLIK